jgi:oxygen-independent coproporphyrinogen-3 oxidase
MSTASTTEPALHRLRVAIAASELPTYVYSYPSKRAYRQLGPGWTPERAWAGYEGPLNLYLHVPFCGRRCSFCTLFLTTDHTVDTRQAYVEALCRQIAMYGSLLPDVEVASVYVGGGTPTILERAQFRELFGALRAAFPRFASNAEIAVEGSPDTIAAENLACLRELGVDRISMGIQTLDPDELRLVGRSQMAAEVERAVADIQAAGFRNTNYDLIYGLEGQTRESWLRSLAGTIAFAPETITIYPIVFRPLTAIERRRARDADAFLANASKYALYDESVEFLGARGYHQDSFVRFTTLEGDGYQQEAADFSGVPLLGLGAGARSYSDRVHYGTEFAVRKSSTLAIIAGFVDHEHRPDAPVGLGFELDADEQRRRFCVLTLSLGRLDSAAYERRFPDATLGDFAEELEALEHEGCVRRDGAGGFELTRKGFKFSNVIGSLFTSPAVRALEDSYVPA